MNGGTANVACFHPLLASASQDAFWDVNVQFGDTLLPFYSEDQLMKQVTSWPILIVKPIVAQLLNKFPIFYRTWTFIKLLQSTTPHLV
jgi:hypothetical protein